MCERAANLAEHLVFLGHAVDGLAQLAVFFYERLNFPGRCVGFRVRHEDESTHGGERGDQHELDAKVRADGHLHQYDGCAHQQSALMHFCEVCVVNL